MALPANFDTETVTGAYVNMDGSPASGSVTFTPNVTDFLKDIGADVLILPGPFTVQLDADGAFSIAIPATDDPDITPAGFTYTVTEKMATGKRSYSISVPAGSGTIDLVTVAPTKPVTASVNLVTSVNGKTGAVSLAAADVGALPDNVGTTPTVASSVVVVANGAATPAGLPDGTVVIELSA